MQDTEERSKFKTCAAVHDCMTVHAIDNYRPVRCNVMSPCCSSSAPACPDLDSSMIGDIEPFGGFGGSGFLRFSCTYNTCSLYISSHKLATLAHLPANHKHSHHQPITQQPFFM